MSSIGTPQVGDSPGWNLKSTVTVVERGSVMYASGIMEMAPCDGTNRVPVGVSAQEYPLETDTAGIAYASEATDIGVNVYDPTKKQKLTLIEEGYEWVLVYIPAGGSDITIVAGDYLVPCLQATSPGCEALVADHAIATPNAAEINSALDEERKVFARAVSNIHQEHKTGSGKPALGVNNADLLSNTAGIDRGWVLAKILLK